MRELVPLGISVQAIIDAKNRTAVEAIAGPVLSDVTVTFTKSGITLWRGGRTPELVARIPWAEVAEFGPAGACARFVLRDGTSLDFPFERGIPGRMNEHDLGLLLARVRGLRSPSPSS